jgi:hypothetical protein
MDDIGLQAIGREILKLTTQAEQLYVENQALRARIVELETPKPEAKVE